MSPLAILPVAFLASGGVANRHPAQSERPAFDAAQRQALNRAEVRLDPGFVFTGVSLPRIEFKDPAAVTSAIGPFQLRTTYYDAGLRRVGRATKVGRYGAVLEIVPDTGPKPYRRYFTLYRRPDGKAMADLLGEGPGLVVERLGVDSGVSRKWAEPIGKFFNARHPGEMEDHEPVAVLLAGLRETRPEEPVVRRTDPLARNRAWWHRLKKQIGDGLSYRYFVTLPKGYDAQRGRRWPVILFLHGAGERGENLDAVSRVGLPPEAKRRGEAGRFPFVLVAPQCPSGVWWQPEPLLDLLKEVKERYRVDPDRVYLTGLSMGGFGSFELATLRPDLFAAVAPICGGGDPADAARLRQMPMWVFHGDADPVVSVELSRAMVRGLRGVGNPVRYTEYSGVAHDSWTRAYGTDALYDWFLIHRRRR